MIGTRITLKSGEILDTVEYFTTLCGNIHSSIDSMVNTITVYLDNLN